MSGLNKNRKNALGKGIGSLLGGVDLDKVVGGASVSSDSDAHESSGPVILHIEPSKIIANPNQPERVLTHRN